MLVGMGFYPVELKPGISSLLRGAKKMKMEFKPEDFLSDERFLENFSPELKMFFRGFVKDVTEQANARLQEMLAECPKVYCIKDHLGWTCDRKPCSVDTHTAFLVNIEEMK